MVTLSFLLSQHALSILCRLIICLYLIQTSDISGPLFQKKDLLGLFLFTDHQWPPTNANEDRHWHHTHWCKRNGSVTWAHRQHRLATKPDEYAANETWKEHCYSPVGQQRCACSPAFFVCLVIILVWKWLENHIVMVNKPIKLYDYSKVWGQYFIICFKEKYFVKNIAI